MQFTCLENDGRDGCTRMLNVFTRRLPSCTSEPRSFRHDTQSNHG
jgi:hypothetical protein